MPEFILISVTHTHKHTQREIKIVCVKLTMRRWRPLV